MTGGTKSSYYLDTSALLKRYLKFEVGSLWVQNLTRVQSGNDIFTSELTAIECQSAFARLRAGGTITSADERQLQRALSWHMREEYVTVAMSRRVIMLARIFLASYVIRSLDAIHLASARVIATSLSAPPIFVTSDRQMIRAANTAGFNVINPESPPPE